MYNKARKEVLRKIKKTGKMPKQSTIDKYELKNVDIKEVMEEVVLCQPCEKDQNKECMGRKGIIYKITSPSGKVYVGQTIQEFNARIKSHHRKDSGCTAISRAIQKYKNQMKYEIIEDNVPQEQLDEREIHWIKELNSLTPNGYNLNTGGRFYEATQEMCNNMRDAKYKSKIRKDGYLGYASQWGNTFYPRIRIDSTIINLSNGGFRTEEEVIEVLKEYTKDPENFTIVDGPLKKPIGCVTIENNRWRVSCKGKSWDLTKPKKRLKKHLKGI